MSWYTHSIHFIEYFVNLIFLRGYMTADEAGDEVYQKLAEEYRQLGGEARELMAKISGVHAQMLELEGDATRLQDRDKIQALQKDAEALFDEGSDAPA